MGRDIARSKPRFRYDDRDAIQEVLEAALEVVFDADLIDGELYGKLVDPEKIDRLETAIEKVQRWWRYRSQPDWSSRRSAKRATS